MNRCVLSRRRKTGRLFASITEVGRLFQMAGTAELKARLPYAVRVRSTWSRGRVDERKVIDEPECWLEIGWWRYSGCEVDCILKAKVASLQLIRSQCMISVEVVRDKTSAIATRRERDSSAPSVVLRLSNSVFRRERHYNNRAWNRQYWMQVS